ncbi:dipeptidase [Deinococcus peraridilitoris]|uniref:Acetylornithine deacetylase/succinyldiaminopimelate desuccinylase-like deacylase n=1 Tax=Deinococcus peraridilitoris (strain DSM 19664 / LMG 22246 / CIP 109416 / KR-200) TaxID=937777 RepID=K9ZYL3_DEIPD|nr:dipeptidase [Deinococcus peraridilitoris]AFZ66017.1 acetylornithine deacetylase/succinyldiaminopimelate desuccinylase-like deacylase [Deinococcus peraridilitoris DSM 19664]
MTSLPPLNDALDAARADAELFDFLRIPSVSADSRRKGDMLRAAEFLQSKLASLGFTARVDRTAGHPVVYAERVASPERPTVLIYGHYDVQPEAPEGEWLSDPFEPTVRDGRIYARGATDDKGQAYAHVQGVELLLGQGDLPVNVKFLLEGEEEVGSPNLETYLRERAEELACDVIVISDGSRFARDVPTVTYGLRGLSYIEVHVQGANRDLHSGSYGGAAPNPINALAQIIARLKDEQGRITIPGFYDSIAELTEQERAMWAQLPHSDQEFAASIGVSALPGEAGYSTLERLWARPTLDVNGIWGGYQGEGSKTVIAAKAGAKISMRLVPGQDPARITKLAQDYITSLAPQGVSVKVIDHHGGQPIAMDLDSPYIAAADRALQRVYGKKAAFGRTGGSIPIVASFRAILGAPVLLVDLGLNEDAPHSPNESFALEDYHNGILTSAYLLQELGADETSQSG